MPTAKEIESKLLCSKAKAERIAARMRQAARIKETLEDPDPVMQGILRLFRGENYDETV